MCKHRLKERRFRVQKHGKTVVRPPQQSNWGNARKYFQDSIRPANSGLIRLAAEVEPFPNPSLRDPIDEAQNYEIKVTAQKLSETAVSNGLQKDQEKTLSEILNDNVEIFRTGFLSSPPAGITSLKIKLIGDTNPFRVFLRNYSSEQH